MTMTMENTMAELQSEVEIRGLGEALEAYATEANKPVSKLNKGDYLTVLGDRAPVVPVVKKTKEELAAEKEAETAERLAIIEKQRADTEVHNNTKVMCVVTDHYTGMSPVDEEVQGRVHEISWGNKMGSVTARVRLDGEPQYLHIATIAKLKTITLPKMGKDSAGKEIASINGGKRFTVVVVDGWSEEKLESEKRRQKLNVA